MTPSPQRCYNTYNPPHPGRLFCALLPCCPAAAPRASAARITPSPTRGNFLKTFSAPTFAANFPKTFFRPKNRHSCARRRNVSKNRHSCAHAYRLIVVMLTTFSKNPTFFFIPSMKSLPCSLSSMAVSNAKAKTLIATIM